VRDIFDHARFAMPGMIAENGVMDAGIFEYGNQWVRDTSITLTGMVHAGRFELARHGLEHILKDMKIALDSAAELGLDLPGLACAKRLYDEVSARGWDDCGTQVLYLSHVAFEKVGLPDLGDQGVPQTCIGIQEGIYKGFIAPVALYAVLAGVMLRNRKSGPEKEGGA